MPSIYTHYMFSQDVKNKLSKNIQAIINENKHYYNIFSQSFDNLYYYNFLSFKPGRKIRRLGSYAHYHNVNDYFTNILTYIKKNNLEDNSEVLCYLFGAINHYMADSHLHPYINYRTGRYSIKRKKETKKYKGLHTNAEIRIDAHYYEKVTNKQFKRFKIHKNFIKKVNFSKQLINTINFAFKETFQVDNMGYIFNKSYNQSKFVYQLLMYDPIGFKKLIYKIIDYITPFKDIVAAVFSLNKKPIEKEFFNLTHENWCNPIDNTIVYNSSWYDVYNEAATKAAALIEESYNFLNNKITLKKISTLLGNNSYATGMDLNDKRITKYYRF